MLKALQIFFIVALLTLTACSKQQLDETNTDPTKETGDRYDPNSLLSTAQFNYANIGYYQLVYQSTMMQVLASTFNYYNNGDKYINSANYTDYQGRIFTISYTESSTIRQMQQLARQKDSTTYNNLISIGDIMNVLIMQRATDTYGDLPYSEANKAQQGIKYPVYDRQQDIYNTMLNDLDKALKKLDATKPKPTADLFYNGDIAKWKKFGYSLMLRLAMRLTKADVETARIWAEKAAAGGTFSAPDDNAVLQTDASVYTSQNGTSVALRTLSDYREVRWSKTLIDYLRNNADPRLGVIAEVPQDGLAKNSDASLPGNTDEAVQIGMPNGYDLLGGTTDITHAPGYPGGTGTGNDFAALGKYSRPRTAVYLKLGGPIFIMTYAESELLLTEAAVRGWNIPGSATQHYANGLKGALQAMSQIDKQAAISPTAINQYANTHPLNVSDLNNALETINTQYWVATGTAFNFMENWFNWKRSGYPDLKPVQYPGNVTGGSIPRRMIYLSTEILNNSEQYKAAVDRLQGGDVLTARVWWDK
ncbi:SusD/RagB family nutrient-binding outer membrane lipoprotein [Mucilaginibacter sp. Bleaf8]|uniref:SusD/RagB family nutrient-binding outer membrane lipoprotein n=1 Tax=Mucilaginibacter sp. Bleaf8 TaxID=2834430 RepID=UPI001BCE91DC|nr:SusD/RagB family nutrient-binding outer membrane lipoprotein [Mucilaginibacter sp. Bleaf8]MBS7567005.1 SusD/RagB family nutrient-binding outer membrane lipoprotein [Mucilaginibacter sp. Bleaf8]